MSLSIYPPTQTNAGKRARAFAHENRPAFSNVKNKVGGKPAHPTAEDDSQSRGSLNPVQSSSPGHLSARHPPIFKMCHTLSLSRSPLHANNPSFPHFGSLAPAIAYLPQGSLKAPVALRFDSWRDDSAAQLRPIDRGDGTNKKKKNPPSQGGSKYLLVRHPNIFYCAPPCSAIFFFLFVAGFPPFAVIFAA